MAGEHHVAHVVDGHVSVYPVIGQFGRHDAPSGVAGEDIQSVVIVVGDEISHPFDVGPVG